MIKKKDNYKKEWYFDYHKDPDKYFDEHWIVHCTDIRKNRSYRYSRADNLTRNEIIWLWDLQFKKSPDYINDVLTFKWLKKMKTIDITTTYEVRECIDMEIWDTFKVFVWSQIQEARIINIDRLWWLVARYGWKCPLYIKDGFFIRKLWEEIFRKLTDEEVKKFWLKK